MRNRQPDPSLLQFGDQPAVNNSNSTWVSRLQCVQAAVNQQIEEWSKSNPEKRVGLVTFNKEVTVFGDGSGDPEVIAGDKLSNHQQLQTIGSAVELDKPLSDTGKALSDRLFSLEESGATALGPALLVAVSMAAKRVGTRVVVCTDGLANVGLGSMDNLANDDARTAAEEWYDGVGNYAKVHGVCVSVISIIGEECRLADLGRITEITGGSVERVNPIGIDQNFASMLQKPIIATNVEATFMIHHGLKFRNEDTETNKVVREVGNVDEDSETTFEYSVGDPALLADLDSVPFQVQIRFTRLNGMRCVRVLSSVQKITSDLKKASENVDFDLLASNAAQQSAKIAQRGDLLAARANNVAWGRMLQRNARNEEQSQAYGAWLDAVDDFDAGLQQQQQQISLENKSSSLLSFGAAAPTSSLKKKAKSRAMRRMANDAHYVQHQQVSHMSSAQIRKKRKAKK